MTGKNLATFIGSLCWFCCLLPTVNAQDFSLESSLSENQIFVGEQLSLKIEIRGSSPRSTNLPELPQIDGLRILNSIPSRGQSISIVNGRTSTVTSYTWTLIGQESGHYRIPSVDVTIDGEVHQTQPLQVEVLEQRSLQAGPDHRRPDIFARIELNDEEPIVGQQLIASVVIYFKAGVEITSYQPSPGWRTDGFWKEQLENMAQPQAETVILDDVRYRKATLLRYAIFPSRSGELTLSPFELNLGIRTRPTRNDPFGSVFGGLGTNQRTVTLESEAINLSVRRLAPPDGATTIGAVGQFEVQREAKVTEASVGETVELTTTITGSGNLPLINKPDYTFPDQFDVYSPQEETDLKRRGMSIHGTRIYKDRFVPRSAGTYTLPGERIAVYDPQNREYDYQVLPAVTFEITNDPAAVIAEDNNSMDIRLLTGGAIWTETGNGSWFASPWLWAGFLIPILAMGIAWRRKSLMIRLENDTDFARSHHAWDQVEELLLKAEGQTNGSASKEVYQLLHKAITGYITDRTGLPAAGLSNHEICDVVSRRTENPDLAGKLKRALQRCSDISYAPIEKPEHIETDIRQTRELLKNLRAEL